MRFSDVARWRFSTRGLVGSDPMTQFLAKVLKVFEFEKMKIPLAVIASDLNAGAPAVFQAIAATWSCPSARAVPIPDYFSRFDT